MGCPIRSQRQNQLGQAEAQPSQRPQALPTSGQVRETLLLPAAPWLTARASRSCNACSRREQPAAGRERRRQLLLLERGCQPRAARRAPARPAAAAGEGRRPALGGGRATGPGAGCGCRARAANAHGRRPFASAQPAGGCPCDQLYSPPTAGNWKKKKTGGMNLAMTSTFSRVWVRTDGIAGRLRVLSACHRTEGETLKEVQGAANMSPAQVPSRAVYGHSTGRVLLGSY